MTMCRLHGHLGHLSVEEGAQSGPGVAEEAQSGPGVWDESQVQEALVQIRAEKRQAAKLAAAANAEMHRDYILCRRFGRRPNRDLVKKSMHYSDRIGALDLELRKLDPQLPPLKYETEVVKATGKPGGPYFFGGPP